jgi:hypothetical protein
LTPISREHVFCPEHWRGLHVETRTRIRGLQRAGRGAHLHAILCNARRWLAARERAA